MNPRKSLSGGRRKNNKNVFTTKSGNVIKVHRNILQRWVSSKDDKERRKAERKAGLPKGRLKRFLYHFQPARMYHYWFSRDGGIMVLKITGIGIITGFVTLVALFAYFRKDLPNITDVSGTNLGGSISYFDRTGQTQLWQDYDAVKRIPVSDKNISSFIKQATVAVEDKDFYKHGGFDVRAIIRAGLNDTVLKGGRQGGSTITNQLVKLTQNWTNNRTLAVKVKELILAIELEREYSKDQILTGYLNVAPYGNIEYGVEAAANDYFHKAAKDLTLDEAAFLAAIPKAPAIYSPYGPYFSKEELVGRSNYVLDKMTSEGMITKAQATEAKKIDVVAKVKPQQNKYTGIRAPWFVLAAKTELENRYGSTTVNRGGWKVITTLDMNMQTVSEQAVAKNAPRVARFGADEAAQVGEDIHTGQIVSLVGGTDFNNPEYGQNNYAAGILIPPGSSFKPYDYTAMIENNNNVGAGSVIYDQLGPLPGYPCTNKGRQKNGGNCLQDYDFLTPGPITLRYALGGSRNIPAVKAMLSAVPNDSSNGRVASINKTISTASAMMDNPYVSGSTYNCYADTALTKTTQCYGASAIGDGAFLHLDDHVNGLATLGRLGQAIPKTYILKITDSANKKVHEFKQPKSKQVIRPDTAYIVNDMASDPRASYLPGSCSDTSCTPLPGGYKFHRFNGWKFAVKTGTTNDGYDGLMASWSSKYAVVSWVGNHTRRVNLNTTMETLTEPLTRPWMEAAHANLKPSNWTPPPGLKTLPAFVMRTHIHYGDIVPSPTNDLFPSWYQAPAKVGNATIDKVSNKLATSCTPNLAKEQTKGGDASTFSVDVFLNGGVSGGTANTNANDDVHQCSDSPPNVASFFIDGEDASQGGTVVCTGTCVVTSTVSAGTHPLNDPSRGQFPGTVNLIVNGQVAQSKQVSDSPSTVQFTISGSGSQSVTIQVIDSVLYTGASSQATVSFASTGPQAFSANKSGAQTSFLWSGGSSPFTVYKSNGTAVGGSCNSTNSHSCSVNGLASGSFYVEDDNGDKSSAAST
ncbi:MAG TPA: transglycosylase domain-containing protein [Candidatus Saccharimonadales bacterium]|nr:transglycosylase domain-containing protein [Candidatus Saccharimonadales bacterium]